MTEQEQTTNHKINEILRHIYDAGLQCHFRLCEESEIDAGFEEWQKDINTLILAEVDKAGLGREQIQQCEDNFREDCDFYFSDPAHDLDDPEAPRNVLDYVAAAQFEAIKKGLRR